MEVFRKAKVIITEVSYHELYKEHCLFNEIYNKLTDMNFKYAGSFNELSHPKTGMPLSADAISIKE